MEQFDQSLTAGNVKAAMVKSAGGRVTAKHLPQAEFKKSIRKQAEPMYTDFADHLRELASKGVRNEN